MLQDIFSALFGGVGAIIYGFPVYMASRKADDVPFESAANFAYAVFVGAVFGGVLPSAIGGHFKWAIQPTPFPLAVGLGLLANPVTPLIIERGKAFFNLAADLLSGRLFGRNG
jgi:hypothetical protein